MTDALYLDHHVFLPVEGSDGYLQRVIPHGIMRGARQGGQPLSIAVKLMIAHRSVGANHALGNKVKTLSIASDTELQNTHDDPHLDSRVELARVER